MKALVAAVIAAGAVATAIGAILALWPDPAQPVAELRADLTELSVDEHVTLSEYKLRQEELDGSSAPAERQLATFAQPPTVDTTTTAYHGDRDDGDGDRDHRHGDDRHRDHRDGDDRDRDHSDRTETDPAEEGDDIIVAPSLSAEAEERLSESIREALGRPSALPRPPLEEVCVTGPHKPACGLSSTVTFMKVADDADPAEVADRLVEVLSETRTESREAVGVTVNYRISVTGFRNRRVDVRWELHRPGVLCSRMRG